MIVRRHRAACREDDLESYHARPAQSIALHQRPLRRRRARRAAAGHLSGDRRDHRHAAFGDAEHRRTRHRGGARGAAGLGAAEAGRARPHPAPRRRHPARPQRRARPARDARHRQGDPGNAGGRRASAADCLEYFGGAVAALQWRLCRSRRPLRLHAARAARRLRRHRRLELSDPDRRLEIRAGARHGQCHGVQAVRKHAAVGAGAGRDLHRGRPAGRAVQRRAGLWRCRRRAWSATRSSPRSR